jgi:hypothetical protein
VKIASGLTNLIFVGLLAMLPVNPLDISGQDLPAPKLEIPLYEGAAPGSEDWDWTENTATTASGLPMVQNVVNPVLLYYPPNPSKVNGTAMIVAPGRQVRDSF